ncbi:Putative Bzip transcription factor [Rhizopus microsporus]|nr:Putative Bzip transcription factor [Rhizopus microsporus]
MSYISNLNLLYADTPTEINDDTFQEELALWANAQFSFDTAPGSAIVDDEKAKEETQLLETFKEIAQLVQPSTSIDNKNNNNNNNNSSSSSNGNLYYNIAPAPSQNNMPAILPRLAPAMHPLGIKPIDNAMTKKLIKTEKESKEPISAEEDKRRRNTAASARFRMKKKLREQALEKKAKELTEYVEQLENKVKDLEKEAKWLRALVVEKDPNLLQE